MNFEKIGKSLKLATSNKQKLAKIALALILSNVFFFLLFGESEAEIESPDTPGTVAIHLEAKILTPLHGGKRIMIVSHALGVKIEGYFRSHHEDGRITVEVPEEEAKSLLRKTDWEILPPLKNLAFQNRRSGVIHEIRY